MLRKALVRGLARDWRATVVFPERAQNRVWAGALADEVEVAFLPASRAAVSELVAGHETTILHSHFNMYDIAAARAARGRASTHLVWHVHGIIPHTPSALLRSLAKSVIARRVVDAIVCVGPNLAKELVRRGASPRQTIYLPNGIDTGRFMAPPPEARMVARESLGLASNRPVVLHYGWSWRVKGGDLFCAAVGELRRRGVEVTALTVGAGAEADNDARRFGIEDELVSLPHTQDVEQLLAASDVFALTSRDEGGNPPFAVLEALASGVPVVAGAIPGQTFAGQLAAYRRAALEPSALADAIEAQLGTTEQARTEAREHIQAERSLCGWADRVHALYDAILDGREPG
jgi:glycosyltransferase involved in cell wall biosynthesis